MNRFDELCYHLSIAESACGWITSGREECLGDNLSPEQYGQRINALKAGCSCTDVQQALKGNSEVEGFLTHICSCYVPTKEVQVLFCTKTPYWLFPQK